MTTVFIVVGFSISAMAVGYLLGRLHQLLDIIEEDDKPKKKSTKVCTLK